MSSLNLTIPVSWNQLSRRQILFVCRLFLAELPDAEFRLHAFMRLTALKMADVPAENGKISFIRKARLFSLHEQQLLHFLQSVNYLTQPSRLSVNRFPVLWLASVRLYGPSSKCYNLSLGEYIHACGALYGYLQSGRFHYLNRLCAVLYRPSGKGSTAADRRCSFNEYSYLSNARWFRFISRSRRLAVLLFFQGCQAELAEAFSHIFPGSSVSFDPVNPVPHLQQIIRVLNHDDVTKNPVILKTPVWEAFAQLNDMMAKIKSSAKNGKL